MARTLNFLSMNLNGKLDVKVESWKFTFNGRGKALKYEMIDLTNYYLPKYKNEKCKF